MNLLHVLTPTVPYNKDRCWSIVVSTWYIISQQSSVIKPNWAWYATHPVELRPRRLNGMYRTGLSDVLHLMGGKVITKKSKTKKDRNKKNRSISSNNIWKQLNTIMNVKSSQFKVGKQPCRSRQHSTAKSSFVARHYKHPLRVRRACSWNKPTTPSLKGRLESIASNVQCK